MSAALLWSFVALFGSACSPYYKSIRAHIPQQEGQGQWQIEGHMGSSQVTDDEGDSGKGFNFQIDSSYSLTDSLVLQMGGHFDTYESESTQIDYQGVHFGGGYYRASGEDNRYRFSLIGGASFETWNYDTAPPTSDDQVDVRLGFTNFESTVVNPFAQLAFTLGSMETNMSFAYRLEVPIFDFQKTQPADLLEQEQTIIHNFVFQGKLGIWDRLSLYCQIVFRNTAVVEEQPYEVMPFDGFLGLSYAFGKFGEDEQTKTPANQ